MAPFAFWNAAVVCIAISLSGLAAEAAPQEALNKTVTVTFSHFTPAKCSDGSTNQYARNVTQLIYVSTQGRLFAKLAGRAGNASKERLVAPSGAGQFNFSGNKMVGTFPQVSGATRETITFDSSYQSCSAEVIAGTESGKPLVWVNLVGLTCTATGKSVISNVACSVRQGNSFAN
jgi:hypothetical protein